VIRNGDRILVWDDYDPTTGEVVAIPLAGGIEFGETGAEAIVRELGEEIGATPTRIDYLGCSRTSSSGPARSGTNFISSSTSTLPSEPCMKRKRSRSSSRMAPHTRRAGGV
jgi:hypothetical protein